MYQKTYHYFLGFFFILSILLPFALIIITFIINNFITKYNNIFAIICCVEFIFIILSFSLWIKIRLDFINSKNKELNDIEKSLL